MEAVRAALSGLAISEPRGAPFIIAIDTEGTSRSGGIREIGAVVADDDAVVFYDTVTQRAKTAGLAPRDAARTWAVVGPRFLTWVRSVTPAGRRPLLVGHNIARHDLPLLRADSAALCPSADWSEIYWFDTLAAVRSQLPDLKRRDQTCVYAHLFGGQPPKHCTHTALADARSAAAIAVHKTIRPAIEKGPHQKF